MRIYDNFNNADAQVLVPGYLIGKLCIGHAFIRQGHCALHRETRTLLEELDDATLDGKRKLHIEMLTTVPLPVINDIGMRKPSRSLLMCLW